MSSRNLILDNKSTTQPFLQQIIGSGYDFPFTMNPTIGCFYGCHYCFSPLVLKKTQDDFFNNVKIKGNFPQKIDKKLTQLNYLPQHFKRVQINESNDFYHPLVFHEMKNQYGRDLMKEIYVVFKEHWSNGNHWMLHILTKSHLIVEHLDILKEMKEMVQVEISICSPDNSVIRKLGKETPNLNKRLKAIEQLAKAGIFVRVMAMPFIGTETDVRTLKDLVFNVGAEAFKHKGLNYYSINDLNNLSYQDILAGKLKCSTGRKDEIWDEFIIKSGELVLENGESKKRNLLWSTTKNWTELNALDVNFQMRPVRLVDCGYKSQTSVDFGYVV